MLNLVIICKKRSRKWFGGLSVAWLTELNYCISSLLECLMTLGTILADHKHKRVSPDLCLVH